jgi:hypothetical protein
MFSKMFSQLIKKYRHCDENIDIILKTDSITGLHNMFALLSIDGNVNRAAAAAAKVDFIFICVP